MKTKSRNESIRTFYNLNGGLNVRTTPLIMEAASSERMQTPASRNSDMFYTGAVAKRLGKTIQGSTLASTSYQSQTTEDLTISLTSVGGEYAIAQKITTGAAVNVASIAVKIAADKAAGGATNIQCLIRTDAAGVPGSSVANGVSNTQFVADSATPQATTFTFSTPPSLSGATVYWFVFDFAGGSSGDIGYMKGTAGAAGNVKTDDSYDSGSWASLSRDLYYVITSTASTSVLQGIYDYRVGSTSTQMVMASMNGALYYHARNATPLTGAWTSLITGLGAGQDVLWSYAVLKNLLFTTDYATNIGRCWNQSASYTIQHGFRTTFALADSAAAGTVPPGFYWIMPVTTLVSGGYRAGAPLQIEVTGASNHQIIVSSVVMNGTAATNFGFDIAALATTWYMTLVSAATTTAPGLFYKIPTANCSAANPAANSTTTFNITATTNLSTSTQLIDNYSREQSYFTNQVTTPAFKYLQQFGNMIAAAGDANNPTRVWFSEVKGPNVWAAPTAGVQIYGSYVDVADGGDNEVIVGLYSSRDFLYVFKRHSVYVIETTGNAAAFFSSRRISENIGALSHWSVKSTGDKLVFLSERGPMEILGTTVRPIQAATFILPRFEPNNADRYNLSAMQYTTAGINSTKSQIWWGVSSTSATTRDLTLVYDFSIGAFWESDVSANVYSEVTDANFFPSVWSGDYSAQVFQMDNGTTDNGSAIDWYWETPNIAFGNKFDKIQVNNLFVQGALQASGTLYADIYLDMSDTVYATYSFSMSAALFPSGTYQTLNYICDQIRVRFRNSELSVPVQLNAIGFGIQSLGQRV